MKFQTENFTLKSAHDQLTLGVTLYIPENPQGIIQFVHGMAEHRQRYQQTMAYFADRGYVVIIHDHRGHGDSVKTDSDLGYFYQNGAQAIVEDVHQVTTYVKTRFPGLKLTLLGHSMGSLVVRCFTKKYDQEIDSLIVCGSPSKQVGAKVGLVIAKILKFFRGDRHRSQLIDTLAFKPHNRQFQHEGVANAWVVSDPAVRELYNADPKSGFIFTLNGFETLFTLMNNTYNKRGWQTRQPDLPIVFLAGADDPCIINAKAFHQAVNFMRSRGYNQVESKLYPGMRHEILNEVHKEEVWQDIHQWIQRSLPQNKVR